MEEKKYRLFFTKKGNIKYISHLDLTKVFIRAFFRADLHLKHSEGFTPHPKISFELPLSVGMESNCESCDFTLSCAENTDDISERLNKQLPLGISITECIEVGEKLPKAKMAEYIISFFNISQNEVSEIQNILSKEIIINKRTKKGFLLTDITEKIKSIEYKLEGKDLVLKTLLPCAGDDYLNPEYICKFICEKEKFKEKCKIYSIMRQKVYY